MEAVREIFLMLQDVLQLQREQHALAQTNNLLLGALVSELRQADPTFITKLRLRIHARLEAEDDPATMSNLLACQEWLASAHKPFMRPPCQ